MMLKEEAGNSVCENICTLVDLFDKAAAEGASDHCGNDKSIYSHPATLEYDQNFLGGKGW